MTRAVILVGLTFALPFILLAVFLGCAGYLVWQIHPAYTFSLAILLSPIAGNWQQLGIPGFLAPDRLLLTAAIAQVLLRSPAVRNRGPLNVRAPHVFAALAVVYTVGSAFAAGTLGKRAPTLEIFDSFGVLPFLAFFTAPVAFRNARERRILIVALVVLGAYLSLTVVVETAHLNALVFPKYILNPNYGIHVGRGRGPFVDAVANGFAMFVCAVACGAAIATWSRRWARILAGCIGILCIVGVLLAEERSVWIGATVAGILTLLSTRGLRRFLIPVVTVSTVGIAAALIALPGLQEHIAQRANAIGPVWDRENISVAAVNMIETRPLTGFGWSRFQAESTDYFRQNPDFPLTATAGGVHNFALLYAVDLGLPGLTLWLLALFTGVGSALRAQGGRDQEVWRTGLIAIFVIFAIVANFVPPTLFQNICLWLWAGVAYGGRYALPSPLEPIEDGTMGRRPRALPCAISPGPVA